MLPKAITKRRKHGFNVPMDAWFKGTLKERLAALLSDERHNLYNKKHGLSLLKSFQQTGANYKANFYQAQKLWSLLMFELWYERYIYE